MYGSALSEESATQIRFPGIRNWAWILLIGILAAAPMAVLIYQAWFNTDIEFLVPSTRGRWILHPPDSLFADKLSGTIAFRRRFELSDIPAKCAFQVRAASRFRMTVNGHLLEKDSRSVPMNWKRARTYEIAPFLAKSGNIIEIQVTNEHGLPALLVDSSPVLSGGSDLSSDARWEASSGPDFSKWQPCVYTNQEKPVFGADRSSIQRPPAYGFYLVLLSVYVLLIAFAVIPRRLFKKPGTSLTSTHVGSRTVFTIALLGIVAILAINIHNWIEYPYSRSYFDADGHVAYVKHVARTWRVPVATQGWQMYQPPLYYFVSAAVYRIAGGEGKESASLKAVQAIGILSGLSCVLCSWLVLKLCSRENRLIQILGTATVAFLPMILYIGPNIGNELFSAAVMSFALYLLVRYGFQDSISYKTALLTGIVFGLALLSKSTAFLLFLVGVAVFVSRIWIRQGQRRRESYILLIFCAAVLAVSGWFYMRNAALFGKPFLANWDRESGFNVEQPPGYRTLGFYLRFGSVLTHTPERSRWSSFWDGYYGSMWMDTHFNMIDHKDEKANSYGTVILGLALLPSVAILLGFFRSLKRVFVERQFQADFALVACVFLGMLALVLHTLQVPSITVLKAFFTLFLVPAFAVFAGYGLHEMARNLGKLRPVLYASLLLQFALTGILFWY